MPSQWIVIGSLASLVSLIVIWNHRSVTVPVSIHLDKIIPGITTVAEGEKILGSSSKCHSCNNSCVYRHIKADSIFFNREIEVVLYYRGPNTGMQDVTIPAVYDGGSIINKIEIETFPRFFSGSNNVFSHSIDVILNWEYHIFNK